METATASVLLRYFGVEVKLIVKHGRANQHSLARKTFWESVDPYTLRDIFHLARGQYLKAIIEAQTKDGGDHERSVEINTAWRRLKHLFQARGIEEM